MVIDNYNQEDGSFSVADGSILTGIDKEAEIYSINLNTAQATGGYYNQCYHNTQRTYTPIDGTITKTEDGLYKIELRGFGIFHDGTNSYHHRMEIYVFEPNAIVEDILDSVERTYPVMICRNDNDLKIYNFSNTGAPYRTDANNTNVASTLYHCMTATISDNSIKFSDIASYTTGVGGICCSQTPNYYYPSGQYTNYDNLTQVYFSRPTTSNYPDSFYGVLNTEDQVSLKHHSGLNVNWVTNGGDLRTFETKSTISIPQYVRGYQTTYNGWIWGSSPSLKVVNQITDSKIHILDNDITHNVSIDIEGCYTNQDNEITYISGALTNIRNSDYIESYDIMCVPGRFNSITDDGFIYDEGTGHKNAIHLATVTPNTNYYSLNTDNSLFIGETDTHIPFNSITDENGDYSVFVRTNYTADSGLKSTFHDLSISPSNSPLTGSPAISQQNTALISVVPNGIIITNTTASAKVYTLNGVKIYEGCDSFIELNKGSYIIHIGNKATTVIIP